MAVHFRTDILLTYVLNPCSLVKGSVDSLQGVGGRYERSRRKRRALPGRG